MTHVTTAATSAATLLSLCYQMVYISTVFIKTSFCSSFSSLCLSTVINIWPILIESLISRIGRAGMDIDPRIDPTNISVLIFMIGTTSKPNHQLLPCRCTSLSFHHQERDTSWWNSLISASLWILHVFICIGTHISFWIIRSIVSLLFIVYCMYCTCRKERLLWCSKRWLFY